MATTNCPTRTLCESPRRTAWRTGASTRNSARSVSGSSPTSVAVKSPPSSRSTRIASDSCTTWLLVRMNPSGVKTNPEPLPPPSLPRLPRFSTMILITGGARHLGKAVALGMAQTGARVAFTYLNSRDEARQTLAEVQKLDAKAQAIPCDIRNKESVAAAVRTAVDGLGGLDILVNNAG